MEVFGNRGSRRDGITAEDPSQETKDNINKNLDPDKDKDKPNIGLIAGIIAGSIALIAGLVMLFKKN
jgi:hypothetical protein